MTSPASFAGHPFHPMLIILPAGLWVFSFVADLIYWFGWGSAIWAAASIRMMAGGTIGALFAAIPGFIDFLWLSGKQRRVAVYHLTVNSCLIALFFFDFCLRATGFSVAPWPLLVSFVGVIGLSVSGWLGGELVYVHGVAVYHLTVNSCLIALFFFDFCLRATGFSVAPWPLLVSFVGVIGLSVSGWLGGELVYVHGVAVKTD